MGSEYMGPDYGPQIQPGQSSHESGRGTLNDDTQPQMRAVPAPPPTYSYQQNNNNGYREPAYREHVTGTLYAHPSDAPQFRQAYPAYPNYAPVSPNGFPPGWYPPYGQPYTYAPLPKKPPRDTYLFGVSIAAFICSILVTLGGFVWLIFLALVILASTRTGSKPDTIFAAVTELTAFTLAGLLGGGFGLYHSVRALFLQKPSSDFKLPWFWLFLLLYGVILALAIYLDAVGLAVANAPFTILLIILAGVLPALTALALAVRRIHYPKQLIRWPTSWRRFTLSLVTGATLAVLLALIIEVVLSLITARALHVPMPALDNPDAPLPDNLRSIGLVVLLTSVIAPLVEESVKPLAVLVMIGRIRSAAEAFVLGMAGGIGFAIIETIGYIGSGYKDWVDIAIQRSSASLLHGLGAGMVGLGLYYITHRNSLKRHRILIGISCGAYAVVQHAIWNGSSFLLALPGPVGSYLENGKITIGATTLPAYILIYVVETALMVIVLLFVTKRLRPKFPQPSPGQQKPEVPSQMQSTPHYAHVG